MRLVACLLGWPFALGALGVAFWEAFGRGPGGAAGLRPLGELWYRLDAGSLNLVQAVVERYLWPALWDPVIANLLHVPALVAFAVPAGLLLGLCHLRRARLRRARGRRASPPPDADRPDGG